MIQELTEQTPLDQAEPLPFPFNQRTFCRYERIEKRIERVRVLVIDDLLRDENDLSDMAREEWGATAKTHVARERHIASMALENILNNVKRLVRHPETEIAHLSELAEAAKAFIPDAIVMSGTLTDFDYYNPEHSKNAGRFLKKTKFPCWHLRRAPTGRHVFRRESDDARPSRPVGKTR